MRLESGSDSGARYCGRAKVPPAPRRDLSGELKDVFAPKNVPCLQVDFRQRSYRKESLLYFVQSIFLLFSALYIAKDALEIALMSGAGSEGGHGHGHGHGHSHSNQSSEEDK